MGTGQEDLGKSPGKAATETPWIERGLSSAGNRRAIRFRAKGSRRPGGPTDPATRQTPARQNLAPARNNRRMSESGNGCPPFGNSTWRNVSRAAGFHSSISLSPMGEVKNSHACVRIDHQTMNRFRGQGCQKFARVREDRSGQDYSPISGKQRRT